MALSYLDALVKKKFAQNVVIKIMGEYFSIRQPDSGLTVPTANVGVVTALTVNPTSIDPFRPSSSINNSSVTLLDKNQVITTLFNGNPGFFQKEQVEIWLGRTNISQDAALDMPFANYFKFPVTYVNKVSKQENRYTFSAVEAKDRIASGAFQIKTKLSVDILSGTTIISLQDTSSLPSAGTVQIESEFISYTGKTATEITGCVRGEQTSVPVDHNLGSDVYLVTVLQANPIDLLLQLLISSGGGGTYDVLSDGAGIDENLVDIAQIETVRDEFFSAYTFKLIAGNMDSLKTFIEQEILFPLGLRLRGNNNSKIGLALLDRNIFEIDTPTINHDELIKNPEYSVDDTKIVNRLRIQWDWSDANQKYLKTSDFTDTDSITEFGASAWTELKFKGIRSALSGSAIVSNIALLFLSRFSLPRPQISVSTHMSSSYLNLGDKGSLISTLLPNDIGELDFNDTLEVISKAINVTTGDVRFGLSFTSFSGVRQCYLAPSDIITSFSSQKIVTIGAGRGTLYRAGWKMRLFDTVTNDYVADAVNEIDTVVGDVVSFKNNWTTTLVNNQYRIKFADYDDVTEQQKKFCFISDGINDFLDGKKPYQISFG